MVADPLVTDHLFHLPKKKMKTWIVGILSSYDHQVETPGLKKQQHQNQLARIAVLLLVSSLCCPLHAQNNNDYVSSDTTVIAIDTKVVISAPLAVFTKSLDVFSTGIPIHPVYIQAPPGLLVWLSIQCKGGAARLSLPDYVANYSWTQTDHSGVWNNASATLNATDGTWVVTGLGIKFNQNISVSNDVLTTLGYGKGADNVGENAQFVAAFSDIAGKATMTIRLNWNVTIPEKADPFLLERSRRIVIWAPTTLTSISTFKATVAALCLLGIFVLCCLGCLNTVAISSLRRFSVSLARETQDQQECEQNRVFNPLWMPCAPTQPEFYNIESTPNPLMMLQRRKELKTKILRMTTPFSLMDRLMRSRHVKSSEYAWVRCRCPCAPATPPLRDSSSDDERSAIQNAASKNPSGCCLRSPSSDDEKTPSEKAALNKNQPGCCLQRGPSRDDLITPSEKASNPTPCCLSPPAPLHCERCTAAESSQMAETARNSIMPRDSQLFSAQPYSPQQGGSQPGATSTLTPTPGQANWRQPQAATMNAQKFPAEPGVYLRSQYHRQDEGSQGNRGRNENITVGYAFIQHRLAPSQGIHTDPNFGPGTNGVFGAEDEILSPILAAKPLYSVSDFELEEEIVAESDLEIESELRSFEAATNPGEDPSLSFFSRGHRISKFPSAERESDSGRTSEGFRSPLSDLFEDVLESSSPTPSTIITWRNDASHYADLSLLRMQESL